MASRRKNANKIVNHSALVTEQKLIGECFSGYFGINNELTFYSKNARN